MYLSDEIQNQLRSKGLISINEVVKKEGDLYIAVNVIDQSRRITNVSNDLIESLKINSSTPNRNGRGLLKG